MNLIQIPLSVGPAVRPGLPRAPPRKVSPSYPTDSKLPSMLSCHSRPPTLAPRCHALPTHEVSVFVCTRKVMFKSGGLAEWE